MIELWSWVCSPVLAHPVNHDHVNYTVSQKDTKLLPITSPNVDRLSKFFHCRLSGKFATNLYLNVPPHLNYVAPHLVKYLCLKNRHTQEVIEATCSMTDCRRHYQGWTVGGDVTRSGWMLLPPPSPLPSHPSPSPVIATSMFHPLPSLHSSFLLPLNLARRSAIGSTVSFPQCRAKYDRRLQKLWRGRNTVCPRDAKKHNN